MKRPIEAAEIRKGDLIRCEWPPDNATEWRAKVDGPAGWGRSESYFLLDRPERIKWAAGTNLWFTKAVGEVPAGSMVTVTKDYYEHGLWVETDYLSGSHYQSFQPHRFTDVRPEPAVELPTEPTLGWIESRHERRTPREKRVFGVFAAGENEREFEQPAADEFGASGRKVNQHYRVTAFTPATAVPTEALNHLRSAQERTGFFRSDASIAVRDFLAAVDEANA